MASTTSAADSSKALFERNRMEYEEMRRRLLETEEKLQSLRRLEEEVQSVTSVSDRTDKNSSVSNSQARQYKSWSQQDDIESVSSALSTVPGSYTGFASHKVSSSTPTMSCSTTKRQLSSKCQSRGDGFESDSSSSSTKENRSGDKYERKLLLQNQRLLMEVERLIGDLHTFKLENASLSKDADGLKKIPDLEERIEELVSESKAQDKALRAAEKHLEESSKWNSELQKKLDDSHAENADLRGELEAHKEIKKAIESQRDEAVQNLIEMQESWEDYQRRAKEKMKRLEQKEDELCDALTTVTQERDDLLEQLSDVQTSVASQEAQINRLLNDVELEDARKHKAEQENQDLLRQLDQLTAQINDFEKGSKKSEIMRQEKLILEQEVSDHRLMAKDVSELLAMLQSKQNHYHHNGSEVTSIQTTGNFMQHDAGLPRDADLNKNNNGLDDGKHASAALNANNNGFGCDSQNMICELRSLFCNMDGEIQRLRVDLKQRDSDDRTYINLREELKILMEKVECGMRRNQELECMLVNLEDDKKCMEQKLHDAMQALEERDRQIQCLDTRLNERNRQVICLQEDVNDKVQRIGMVEKEIRELRKLLDEKTALDQSAELESCYQRIKELEDVLIIKENIIADLQSQLINLGKEMKAAQVKFESKVQCLSDQLSEYQRQVAMLTEEVDMARKKHQNCAKSQDDLRRTLRAKDAKIQGLETELDEVKLTLEEKDRLHIKLLEGCQDKLKKSNEQIQNLESALMMCKNEINKHLSTMEELKKHFENELEQKDACIKSLTENCRRLKEDLDCKVDEVNSLEHTMMTLKCKIEQLFHSLKESEQNNNCICEKLKQCENQNMQEKASCLKEMEELDRKLAAAINNLNCCTGECNTLKNQLAEKSSIIDCLTGEKNSLSRDLISCKQKACELQDQLNKMEADNTELCQQLQHKMECIKDLESALFNKDHELKACTRCIEDLNNKFEAYKNMMGNGGKDEKRALLEKIKICGDELLKKNRLLSECEEALKRCQFEVQSKNDEIKCMQCKLDELNCRLQDRVVKVEELEHAIEALHKDTDKRMKRVDEQLRRYECELSDKVRQLTDLDECLNRCQHNLNEKNIEYCKLEQQYNRLCSDLQLLAAKLKDMEEQRDCCGKHLSEAKAENAEITQELRITREELQTQHQELIDTKNALTVCNREMEKLQRCIDDMKNCLEQRESELQKCTEEKNALLNKIAHLQCRLENETCQAAQQMADLKANFEKELENCRACNTEIEEHNSCLAQKLAATHRQLQQVEKCCHQQLDGLNRELEDLLNRLADREDQISACKDTIMSREQEINRLKLRLCSCDNKCCNNSYELEDDVGRLPVLQDELGVPTLTKVTSSKSAQSRLSSQDIHKEDTVEQSNRLTLRSSQPKSGGGQGQSRSDDEESPEEQSSDDKTSSSARNSLGVSEVHERLRSNQRLQMEIEKQLKSLEENVTEDVHRTDQC